MKTKLPHFVRKGRITEGPLASTDAIGNNGIFEFFITTQSGSIKVRVQVSDGKGWDHVSISLPGFNRTPTWDEMCAIKDVFFNKDEIVIQYHPPESEYVNYHPYCLHLWRPHGHQVKLPPKWMIGPGGKK